MFAVRKSQDRGDANHGWLKSRHTFSFAGYYDPKFMGFRSLRVINEDRIDGGTGFDRHPHKEMEIISYVVKGALQHRDSMGNVTVIRPGEVQKLSAGTGIAHSEYNYLPDEESHFFQIWITPNKLGLAPSYGQKSFEDALNSQKMVLAISGDGREGSIQILQDAEMFISRPKKDDEIEYVLRKNRGAWIQIVSGEVDINGKQLFAGDALAIDEAGTLKMKALEKSEFLLFDLA